MTTAATRLHWVKHGRIYVPDGSRPWAQTHGFPPIPVVLADGRLRVFCTFCDADTVGRVGWVDLDPDDPSRVLGVAEEPVLDIGSPGTFDERGVVPTCVIPVGDELWMYYVGYQRGEHVTYYQFQGLAISTDGGASFMRHQRVPVIDRSDTELVNRTSAFVRQRAGGDFEMWYVAGSEWTVVGDKPLPVYNLRHITSPDGIHWPDRGEVCLDFEDPDEHALGRPWVTEIDGVERLFYSVRTRSQDYRIGMAARGADGSWERRDAEVGIDVSADGWDGEAIAYAAIHHHGDRTYLLHNGNLRGRTGFGWAELQP